MSKTHVYPDWETCELPRADAAAIEVAVQAALRQERIEIARMLEVEARQHDDAAEELLQNYDRQDVRDEVWDHEHDACMLRRIASEIRARTPAAPASAEMTDEIAF